MDLPARHGSAQHQTACNNSARLIANIFILTENICGRGQGKGRAGWGERPQDLEGRQGGKRQRRGEEQEWKRADGRRVGDREEYDGRKEEHDGGTGARRTGPGHAPRPDE